MKQTRKEICARYYLNNKEKIKVRNKIWRENNLEKVKEAHRIWVKHNEDRMKFLTSKWKKENKDRHIEHNKKYNKNNLEKIKSQNLAQKIPLKSSCNICKIENNLERHHWDYNQPFLVATLCKDCHTIQHIKNFGGN